MQTKIKINLRLDFLNENLFSRLNLTTNLNNKIVKQLNMTLIS